MKLNLDPAGGDGNGGNTFLAALPEELRKEPSLATFKDPGTLAKSYVEAQKLIGAKRIALPGEKAAETEWEAFYNQIGRPDTADKYEDVVLKDETGKVLMEPDKAQLGELKKFFHKMGLTTKQARQMQEYSLQYLHKNAQSAGAAKSQEAETAISGLRQEWGDKFDTNVDIAKSVVKKFGDEQFLQYIEQSGMGNNAALIKMLNKVGQSIFEDSGRRGLDNTLPVNDLTRAQQEIETLKTDSDFQKALGDATHVGHQAAVTRWMNLHKVAHPGAERE